MSEQDFLFHKTKKIHLLIDPDKWEEGELASLLESMPAVLGSIIVAGTFIHTDKFDRTMTICAAAGLPVGNILTVGPSDSVISPLAQFVIVPVIIGASSTRFVVDHLLRSAPVLNRLKMSVCSLAYLMLDGGVPTAAQYFTQTQPIPRNKEEIVGVLSLTARYLGLAGIYLEAGSGAIIPITAGEIETAKAASLLPVVVGGGIKSVEQIQCAIRAGADAVILGTVVEERRDLKWLNPIQQ
jgi:phosphoglycerol geranylgeranyltransferase